VLELVPQDGYGVRTGLLDTMVPDTWGAWKP
jgi:hypothetical protein